MYALIKSVAFFALVSSAAASSFNFPSLPSGPQCGALTCELTDSCCGGEFCIPAGSNCCPAASNGYCEAASTCCGSVCCGAGDVCVKDGHCAPASCQNNLASQCDIAADDITCENGNFPSDGSIIVNGKSVSYNQKCTSSKNNAVNFCYTGSNFVGLVDAPSCSGSPSAKSSSSSDAVDTPLIDTTTSINDSIDVTNSGVANGVSTYTAISVATLYVVFSIL